MPKSILDPTFKYIPAVATDIRKTFARARKEMGQQQQGVLTLVPKPRQAQATKR